MAPFAQKRQLAHLKHAGGRPSEYKQEFCDKVVEAMAAGLSLTAFAGSIRVARETVYAWTAQHREFSDAVARGRAARTLHLERKLLAARYGAQCSAAIFALKNAQPDEWRDLKHTETMHLHAIAQLTDAQLNAIAAGQALAIEDNSTIDAVAERE